MKYKRGTIFSISTIIDQVIDYLKENKKLPEVIYLPPEERIYLAYLLDRISVGIDTFQGIPLDVYYDPQEREFTY